VAWERVGEGTEGSYLACYRKNALRKHSHFQLISDISMTAATPTLHLHVGADIGGLVYQQLDVEKNRGAIHQLLSIILKLRILVLSPVSTMPYEVIVKNYSLIGE
jgi:hypothetical protein